MFAGISIPASALQTICWPDHREVPCRDMDLDCFAFDRIVPFGDYRHCQAYAPELGRCIFAGEAPLERGQ
jgi:hypothetical protein